MKKKIVCILCPIGCELEIEIEKNKVVSVKDNLCEKGIEYAKKEIENPTRSISSFVSVQNSKKYETIPVKVSSVIPKSKIFDVMNEIKKIQLKAPIKLGDIIIKNVLNLNVDIVVTRSVEKDKSR
ncbi:MAG: DUF1667 domain-containing protein [Deltaproteobacteria bacterium]|nr:DUF1667 domain-containing protein [Deltaproteobacteria bacterium]